MSRSIRLVLTCYLLANDSYHLGGCFYCDIWGGTHTSQQAGWQAFPCPGRVLMAPLCPGKTQLVFCVIWMACRGGLFIDILVALYTCDTFLQNHQLESPLLSLWSENCTHTHNPVSPGGNRDFYRCNSDCHKDMMTVLHSGFVTFNFEACDLQT